ncbi:MAG: hypothetical protein E6G34_14785 [Actinobacteria bacterium]|nr:MAG: hypothetical protein E6G34_14785 [Actinomycetota bacterium]
MQKAITIVTGAVLALACASNAAATPLRYGFGFMTQMPGASTGLASQIVYGTDASGKPKPVAAERVDLPVGSSFDETVVPACTASDVELYLFGTAACPESSQVGGGSGAVDTGCGPPIDPVYGDIYVFHAPEQLLFAGTPPGSHQVASISRLQIRGSTLEISNIPVTPGCLPDGETVGQEVNTSLSDRTDGSHAFLTTPTTCRRRTWTSRLLISYRDGSSEMASASTPCTNAAM